MKKNLVSLVVITMALVLFSCSKEKNENPGQGQGGSNGSVSKIKTWSNSSSQNTYLYNNEGKLTEVSSNTGSKRTYEYAAGKVTYKEFTINGNLGFTAEYTLDGQGLGITEKRPDQPSYTGTFIYNSQKQPVKWISDNNGTIQAQDFFYSNGNCDSVRIVENGVWAYTRHFTHYTDKLNQLSNEAYGYPFFGKESKNLRKTDQFIYPDGTKTELVSSSYEFDSNGRPIKQTSTQGANIYINYISYY